MVPRILFSSPTGGRVGDWKRYITEIRPSCYTSLRNDWNSATVIMAQNGKPKMQYVKSVAMFLARPSRLVLDMPSTSPPLIFLRLPLFLV
jgi:hypothetical protein